MTEFVDTHCHIQSIGLQEGEPVTRELWAKAEFTADQVVDEAVAAGVTRLLCVGCSPEDSQLAIDFVQHRDHCWASVGIHPHEAEAALSSGRILPEFAGLATKPKVVAIGECGLDYYYTHSSKADQLRVLEFQLALAQEAELPVIFHVREAFDDFWPVFDAYHGLKGVLHSFTDSAENLEQAIKRGLYIGVNGIATFTKDPAQLDVYRTIPLEKLLLETDAPFLTPTPYRGKVNEPKRVVDVGRFLAELRDESDTTLAAATTRNARHLFGI